MKSDNRTISIIRCNPENQEDFSKLSDAYSKLLNNENNLLFLSLSNIPFDSHTISAFLKNARAGNEIIGISTFKSDSVKIYEIIGIVVDVNYQNRGIGKALINKGIEIAREKGFKAVDISVFADNKAMLILLIKMDFKPIKIEYHARFDGEDIIHLKRYF